MEEPVVLVRPTQTPADLGHHGCQEQAQADRDEGDGQRRGAMAVRVAVPVAHHPRQRVGAHPEQRQAGCGQQAGQVHRRATSTWWGSKTGSVRGRPRCWGRVPMPGGAPLGRIVWFGGRRGTASRRLGWPGGCAPGGGSLRAVGRRELAADGEEAAVGRLGLAGPGGAGAAGGDGAAVDGHELAASGLMLAVRRGDVSPTRAASAAMRTARAIMRTARSAGAAARPSCGAAKFWWGAAQFVRLDARSAC